MSEVIEKKDDIIFASPVIDKRRTSSFLQAVRKCGKETTSASANDWGWPWPRWIGGWGEVLKWRWAFRSARESDGVRI